MKNFGKLFGIFSIVAIIVCTMLACDAQPQTPNPATGQTPVAGDYDFGNMTQYADNITAVIITPKSGKSSGARTIYYEGTGATAYTKSLAIPAAAGTYAVTFDVMAVSGWNEAKGLSAGVLTIGILTPVADDFIFTNVKQSVDKITHVVITPKDGKSKGAQTIYYEGTSGTTYTKNTALPTAAGKYAVTFDVAAVTGSWSEAKGLSAGVLDINTKQTPKESDYTITIKNLNQTVGSVTAAADVTKNSGSDGEFKIYYEGVSPTIYAKSSTLPTLTGKYTVTLEVAETPGWNPATFVIGTLIINNSNQALSVTILGTPQFPNILTADVVKNFSGKVEYQWQRNGENISNRRGEGTSSEYRLDLEDVGKAIKVKVKCGEKTDESQQVTIPLLEYTVKISWHNDGYSNYLRATGWVGEEEFYLDEYYFDCQWFMDGVAISGEEMGPYYNLNEADVGRKFHVKVTTSLSKKDALSNTIQITAPDARLAGTTWMAWEEGTQEDGIYARATYTLAFSASTWQMQSIVVNVDTNELITSGYQGGTYTVSGNTVVLHGDDLPANGVSGTVYSYNNRIVFTEGGEMTFYRQN